MTEVSRLLEDPADDVGPALQALAAVEPVDFDVDAGAARFEQTLAQGGAGGLAGGTLLRVVGVVALVGGIVAGGVALASTRGAEAPAPAVAAATIEAQPLAIERESSPERAPPPANPEPALAPPVPEPSPDRAAPTRPARPRAIEASPPPSQEDRTAAEMQLLNRSRKALRAGDAATALALAERGKKEFSGGMFGEEWEAIAILALAGLGRREAAAKRAGPFLEAHPNGRFEVAIERALAEELTTP